MRAYSFVRMSKERAIPKHVKADYEDPIVWRTEEQYHVLG